MEHQNDRELHELLAEWKVPAARPSLESRVLKSGRPWWHVLLHGYIRVPVPVACCMALLMVGGAWRIATLPAAGCSIASVISPAGKRTAIPQNVRKQPPAPACAVDATC